MKIVVFKDNIYEENAYLIKDLDVTIIDPGFNFVVINNYLKENELPLNKILLTHGHIDHIGELDLFVNEYPDVKIYISEKDYPMLYDRSLNASKLMGERKNLKDIDNNVIIVHDKENIGGFNFYLTPGHTKGSGVYLYKEYLFTGDTLFRGTVGRTDLEGGKESDLIHSLKMIMESFSKKTIILPGHYSKTTLLDEIKNNQYLKLIKGDKK